MKKFVFPLVFGIGLSCYAVYSVLDTLIIPDSNQIIVEDKYGDKLPENENDEIITENNEYLRYYKSSALEIKIYKEIVKTKDKKNKLVDTIVFCADVRIIDVEHLLGRFASNKEGKITFGRNIYNKTSKIASDGNAVFAISGDNYAGREYGYVVRNGEAFRDSSRSKNLGDEDLVIWNDGSFEIIEETKTPLNSIMSSPKKPWQVFSFGPALVNDYKIVVENNSEVSTGIAQNYGNQRSVIGIIEPLHYFITISEGRLPDSYGQSLYEAAEFIHSKGVKVAYNLDGGGSATMWFRGEVLNRPKAENGEIEEREIGDAILFK
ncbi:MAG: phosphodiester glycosidase family protein [Bacilli bacterium]|nr:phosphodiester glycosidase family protein [Bacilli bacterium]